MRAAIMLMLPLSLVLALILVLVPSRTPPVDGSRPLFVVTIPPLAAVVRELAGDHADVHTLLPPGASPHVFAMRPQDRAHAARARAVITIGAGLDEWATELERPVISATTLLPIAMLRHGDGRPCVVGHTHDPDELDPHWWLDARIVAELLAPLAEQMAEHDPQHAADYRAAAVTLAQDYMRLDQTLRERLAVISGTVVVTQHPAFGYFFARYGLTEYDSLVLAPGAEPTPAQLRRLAAELRSEPRALVASEVQANPQAAERLAEMAGCQSVRLDPLGGDQAGALLTSLSALADLLLASRQ